MKNNVPFFKGMNYGFYARNGYYSSSQAKLDVDRMADIGINWVCVIAIVLQETFSSTRQFRDFEITPSDDEIRDIIGYIHSKGMKVMLRPMIECWDGTQRCHINFPDDSVIIPDKPITYWKEWFESYAHLTRHYTRLAARAECEAYGLDSELNGTVRQSDHWMKIIDIARKEFNGHLTSSLINTYQFRNVLDNPNHWFYALDSLGSSMYSPASQNGGGTVDEMCEYIKKHVVKDYADFAEKYGKPFYFGECGCCSTAGASKLPYFWDNGGGYDGQEQANYLEATIKAFSEESWWTGLLWWKWDEQNLRPQFLDDPAGDKGFTICGKPAENVFQRWGNEEI